MHKILGIVITDGVGYRNYVMSNFMEEASLKFQKIIIYSGLPKEIYELHKDNIEIKELAVFAENNKTWFFRKSKEIAHLQQYKSFFGMKDLLKSGYPKNNKPKAILAKIIYLITRFFNSHQFIIFIEKMQFWTIANHKTTQSYIKLLHEDNPDFIFFTHQRPAYLTPFLYSVLKLKIPVSSFIFSWDNLSSKGRMLGTFEYFLVWSELMKKELLHFYPSTKSENIAVVGTPQFEPYSMDAYSTDKIKFIEKFKLDPLKKIICFSCADSSIGQNDAIVIKAIANAIRDNRINFPSQLLVRTSPAEDGKRFEAVRTEFPEIVWNIPKWQLTRENHSENWSQRIPTTEDFTDLKAILKYVDLNVNMCSTMSLDFMIFGKPIINTVFGNESNGLYNDQRFLNYTHYKKVIDSGAVVIAKEENDLIDKINFALEFPEDKLVQQEVLVKIQISKPIVGTGKRITEALLNFMENAKKQ
ncbi:MAG: hypothetical protein V4548_04230 [Bacteroidota bacterium]